MTIHELRYLAAGSKSCVSSSTCHMLLCSATDASGSIYAMTPQHRLIGSAGFQLLLTTTGLRASLDSLMRGNRLELSALIRACACMHVKPDCHAICCWCQTHPMACVVGHTQALHPADLVRHVCNVIHICK